MDTPLIRHHDEVDWIEAMPQMQGGDRVAIKLKILHSTEDCLVSYTRYEPRLVVEPHWHHGREVIYVLDGEVTLKGRRCPAGTMIVLEYGTAFGPVVVGDEGAYLLEVFVGRGAWDLTPIDDDEEWAAIVAERDLRLVAGTGHE